MKTYIEIGVISAAVSCNLSMIQQICPTLSITAARIWILILLIIAVLHTIHNVVIDKNETTVVILAANEVKLVKIISRLFIYCKHNKIRPPT
jgi:hypothetical protein